MISCDAILKLNMFNNCCKAETIYSVLIENKLQIKIK